MRLEKSLSVPKLLVFVGSMCIKYCAWVLKSTPQTALFIWERERKQAATINTLAVFAIHVNASRPNSEESDTLSPLDKKTETCALNTGE